ncbi:MAG: TlpA family protein disulfide reductase [Bacteroidetes bacterium]|nr:TlpA family protein disulfide reductase [Bacteroidota bacterium]MBX7047200.1 TlpA family protein disulfide reductase [Ignavibacteria bacterium]
MRKNILIAFALVISIGLYSCGKKGDNTTTENKKDNTPVPTNNTTPKTSSTSGASYYTVSSVTASTSKNTAPNFTWEENGKKMSMDDLKGNVVLVNLWATWCGPCKKEIPDLSKISQDLKDKNFKMIGVNIFQNPKSQSIGDFLKENPIPYTILDANEDFVKAFADATKNEIEAVPTTFIVDKKGNIVETIVGARDEASFTKTINKYLN